MDLFLLVMCHVCLCYTVLSFPCSHLSTCCESRGLLSLLYVNFSCGFVSFPIGVSGKVWYLIALILDISFLSFCHSVHYQHKFLSTIRVLKIGPSSVTFLVNASLP